ncbi:MAG: glycosyltransferase family 4 protein [Kiritimatiellae bacterium]|nr:glycosyltransferase family 4 protein [Kiritimatiellia bacterium]
MRVIYDLEAYAFGAHGGIARMFDETILRLSRKPGFRACLYAPWRVQRRPPAGPRIRTCHWRPLPRALGRVPLLNRVHRAAETIYWKTRGGDIYHPSFYNSRPRVGAVPCVVNVYDLTHEKFERADDMPDHRAFGERKRQAIARAARVICISEATRQDLLRFYDVDPDVVRVATLAGGAEFRRMDPDEADRFAGGVLAQVRRPFLLFVGSRQRYKNFHRFLLAYSQWPRRRDIDLVVVGAGQQLVDCMVRDLGGEGGSVHYAGYVPDATLCALYNKAAGFVYPSLSEGFGIPLLEAIACNCPVCASDLPVFREVAGPVARYFDPYSPESMQQTLDACLGAGKPAELSAAALEQLGRFSWDKCAEAVWEVYRELV